MSDIIRTRLCLSDSCGQPHECRHPYSACVCPFCGSDALETVRAEPLPGFDEIAVKSRASGYPS